MSTGVRPPPTRSWWRRNGLTLAALILVVGGTVVFVLAPTTVPAYGWTAYTPLTSGPDFADYARKSSVTGQHLVGAGIAVVGFIMLAGAVGFRLGARRGPA